MRELKIAKNDSGIRLDKFMSRCFPTMPKSLIYKYIRLKCIKINGKKAVANNIIKEGDTLTFYINEEFFEQRRNDNFLRNDVELNIIYEDKNIIIVHKDAGVIVHSDSKTENDDLINHIKSYLNKKGEFIPEKENSFAPALCNRIDRNTEGLVIAAKNAKALREMNTIFKDREVERKYLCVVYGIPQRNNDILEDYLIKCGEENKVNISKSEDTNAKLALLRYRIVKASLEHNLSLLEVELITGRTHQIRAQLAAIGHPILGDRKYAEKGYLKTKSWQYQALCAFSLRFKLDGNYPLLNYLNNQIFTSPDPKFLNLF